jgi:hypothetical protein
MNNFLNCSEDNVVHNLYNIPSCIVAPMFSWNVLHLQELKQLHCFCDKMTLFQKQKNNNKLQNFLFLSPI